RVLFRSQAFGRRVTEADDPILVFAGTFLRLAGAGNDEALHALGDAVGRHRVAEGLEAGAGGRVDLRAHVGARHGVVVILEDAPPFQRADVYPIEVVEALIGEGGGRPELACTERGEGAPQRCQVQLDRAETVVQRQGLSEAHSLDGVTRLGGDAARILKRPAHVPVTACLKQRRLRHLPRSANALLREAKPGQPDRQSWRRAEDCLPRRRETAVRYRAGAACCSSSPTACAALPIASVASRRPSRISVTAASSNASPLVAASSRSSERASAARAVSSGSRIWSVSAPPAPSWGCACSISATRARASSSSVRICSLSVRAVCSSLSSSP